MTSLDHLLPAPDEVVRCADHARSIGIDPGGTAIRADRLVLVETSLPWPKPVFDHPTLREIDPLFKQAGRVTRLLACHPDGHPDTRIWVFDRLDGPTRERIFTVSSPDRLLDLCRCLAAEEQGNEPTSPLVAAPMVDHDMADRAVLVCTQGSHDVCCGSDGARFAQAAEASVDRVFRVSHTGGHRFAPTAMTLPDGRMWAYLVPELLDEIVNRSGDPAQLAQFCRGWWGAETGPAQVAERAVFARMGFEIDELSRTVTCRPVDESDEHHIGLVRHGGRAHVVEVQLHREVPTIGCRKLGGLPAKTAREFSVGTVQPLDG